MCGIWVSYSGIFQNIWWTSTCSTAPCLWFILDWISGTLCSLANWRYCATWGKLLHLIDDCDNADDDDTHISKASVPWYQISNTCNPLFTNVLIYNLSNSLGCIKSMKWNTVTLSQQLLTNWVPSTIQRVYLLRSLLTLNWLMAFVSQVEES